MSHPTPEGIRKLSKTMSDGRMKGKNNHMYGRPAPHGKVYGWGGIKFRSTWEAKYAQWLTSNKVKWEYEPRAFELSGGLTFRPDFHLPDTEEWIEIKGLWRDDAKLKWDKFYAEYPELSKTLLQKDDLKKLGVL